MDGATENSSNSKLIIFILGALATLSPFSIDMYLSAFPQIAADLHSVEAQVSLSISSYFIGLALGQVLYGPLLDRFGRKMPIYCGLLVYFCATIGCMQAQSIEVFIALRFIQALGGCVAQVAAFTMVRDFFHVSESSKIFSLLMLMIGVSPLLAPTVGTFVTAAFGWRTIFVILAGISLVNILLVRFLLPTTYLPNKDFSLHPKRIMQSYLEVFNIQEFRVPAVVLAFTFAGLFAYVAGSPIIFLNYFNVTPNVYGLIFAILTGGFIISNQFNIWLQPKFKSESIFRISAYCALGLSIALVLTALYLPNNLVATIVILFLFLFAVGLNSPNGSALALAPFSKNIGTAAALLGLFQMGIGAIVSSGVGILGATSSLPVFLVFLVSTGIASSILLFTSPKPCNTEEARS